LADLAGGGRRKKREKAGLKISKKGGERKINNPNGTRAPPARMKGGGKEKNRMLPLQIKKSGRRGEALILLVSIMEKGCAASSDTDQSGKKVGCP